MTRYIAIDTNVFYSYIGRDALGMSSVDIYDTKKINSLLDKALVEKKLFIDAIVIFEALVHFRNDTKRARKILEFVKNRDIKVLPLVLKANSDIVENIAEYLSFSDDKLKIELNKVLNYKIGIECQVASDYIEDIVHIFSFTIGTSETNSEYWGRYFDGLRERNFSQMTKDMMIAVREYYDLNCEVKFDSIWQNALKGEIIKTINDLDAIRKDKLNIDEFKNQMAVSNNELIGAIMKYEKFDVIFEEFIQSFSKHLCKKRKYNAMQVKHIIKRLKKICEKNLCQRAKFKKNDIEDTILLEIYNLFEEKSFYLLSYDKDIIDTIKSVDLENYNFIEGYRLRDKI